MSILELNFFEFAMRKHTLPRIFTYPKFKSKISNKERSNPIRYSTMTNIVPFTNLNKPKSIKPTTNTSTKKKTYKQTGQLCGPFLILQPKISPY